MRGEFAADIGAPFLHPLGYLSHDMYARGHVMIFRIPDNPAVPVVELDDVSVI
jgi:hypothetical protein